MGELRFHETCKTKRHQAWQRAIEESALRGGEVETPDIVRRKAAQDKPTRVEDTGSLISHVPPGTHKKAKVQ